MLLNIASVTATKKPSVDAMHASRSLPPYDSQEQAENFQKKHVAE